MDEDPKERIDRELRELNEELRVLLPGVQILAALLFTVAFSSAFKDFSVLEQRLYYTGFVSSTIATVLLISPGVQHRLIWRQPKKGILVRAATVTASLASLAITVAIISTCYLVGEWVYDNTVAAVSVSVFGGLIFALWYVAPLLFHLFGPVDEPGQPKQQRPQPAPQGGTREREPAP